MKIYRVYYEVVTIDRGIVEDYKTKGYYTTRAKAEEVRAEVNKKDIVTGKAYVEEIEVEE